MDQGMEEYAGDSLRGELLNMVFIILFAVMEQSGPRPPWPTCTLNSVSYCREMVVGGFEGGEEGGVWVLGPWM